MREGFSAGIGEWWPGIRDGLPERFPPYEA